MSTADEPIKVSQPLQRPQLILPSVDEIRMRDVTWVIINDQNIDEKIEEIRASGEPFALFVLTADGYENLALNLSDIRALVQQQQEIIVAYENYYTQAEEAFDEASE